MSLHPIVANITYAAVSGFICIIFMLIAYYLFDTITPFDTSKQLNDKNQAVGNIIAGIFIGVGIAMGLTIGLSLN